MLEPEIDLVTLQPCVNTDINTSYWIPVPSEIDNKSLLYAKLEWVLPTIG
jgi:hypothetical protein